MTVATLLGAASIPSAPVLLDGVGVNAGPAVEQLRTSVRRVVERLPAADVTILVAAGQSALHDTARIDLTGLAHPQFTTTLEPCPDAIAALSRVTQYPRVRRPRLPLDLAVLGLFAGRSTPVVALEVPATAEFAVLSALGTSVVQALGEAELTATLVVAGDLSAGLDDHAPLASRPGAVEWDARVVELFTRDATDGLAQLGPGPAADVGARGWAALCVLHGAVASARLALHVRRYTAPRGVGYLVMSGR
ncbi:hypothetical protein BH23ACT10_BH23ACT10_10390 [soil metagenome]